MTEQSPQNIIASIHQRLLNVSKQTERAFNDLVIYYALERFLYRLSLSAYADRVILKGGLMLQVWNAPVTRVTRDIDLLGRISNDLDNIKEMVRAVCNVSVDDDGLVFDPETVTTARIAEDADYEGVRATFKGRFGKMPLAMQVDFGFTDVITPEPVHISYPSILDHPPAQLLAYNRETVVAEKFEAMVKLGELNSRMKDFFDVWLLAQSFAFDETVLTNAIRATFARRQTTMEQAPACFTDRFKGNPEKSAQWRGFVNTNRVGKAPADFGHVVAQVQEFLQPIVEAIVSQNISNRQWQPGGFWA